ncbi:FeS assembly protein SufD [Thiomicrospira aerophila AL3]|uniref:FeS assembly protein SufD n=1 Tax=Thiomicrospira aerophila AL3 TaxID=717772 RepID=W0DU79_9GAMM|nr:Fe-S cluster assembly protein SufD [Thiomicrospira aerophila]AHF00554.1 FeS assembly protein SufD [Thiomicrospira aerophila AL3]
MTTLSKPMKKFSPVAQAAMDYYQAQATRLIQAEGEGHALARFRQAALNEFIEQGFPSRKDEDWQFTPLSNFLKTHYHFNGISRATAADIAKLRPFVDAWHLVFVDGYFSESLSDDLVGLPDGVSIESGKDALDFEMGFCVFAQSEEDIQQDAFGMLNAMLFDDGVFIEVAPHVQLEKPIVISYVQTLAEHANIVRNKIKLGSSASLNVIEQYVAIDDGWGFENSVCEIELAANARLNQVVWQNLPEQATYFNNQFIDLAEHSQFRTHYIGLGGAISRHQNHVQMDGDRIESEQNSVCFARNQQIVDTRTYTGHKAEQGLSRQLHKLVLADQAIGVFNGMIKVDQVAQKTDGMMDNKNLLLSNKAQMNAKPQLEIYADDVKCSHGSASGQISADQIFYLQARGLSKQQARQLVTLAFLMEPLETVVAETVRTWLQQALADAVTPHLS